MHRTNQCTVHAYLIAALLLTWDPPEENWMMIGASFFLAASRQALIPEDDTQFTAGMA